MQPTLEYAPVLPRDPLQSRFAWLGWAVYLAMSWTWCIGMFLPVLLIRDYGYWSWILFAIPNVVGAAALGWVLSSESSASILIAHRAFVTLFSAATAAFQLFFAVWIFHRLGLSVGFTALTLALTILFSACVYRSTIRAYWISTLVFLISMGCWFAADRYGEMAGVITVREHLRALESISKPLLYLTPAMFFGFALCPYLDATFLSTRASFRSSSTGRSVFNVGFGAVFLSMLVFTLLYSIVVWINLSSPGNEKTRSLTWIAVHWCTQLSFTVAIHIAAIGRSSLPGRTTLTCIIAAAVSGIALGLLTFAGVDGEILYGLFMGFYALVFPGYVWLCMIPSRARVVPSRRQLIVLAVAVLITAPMFWMGFIERQMIWVLPGLAVVLAARLLIPKRAGHQDAMLS